MRHAWKITECSRSCARSHHVAIVSAYNDMLSAHQPLALSRTDQAVRLTRALVAGGLRVLEITLRTPMALAAIEAMRKTIPWSGIEALARDAAALKKI